MTLLLSKRQKLLYDRLLTLGKWARTDELPITIVEIVGFGSFFRGKEEPKDVDLILYCETQSRRSDVAHFFRLLHKVRYGRHAFSRRTPKEVLLAYYDEQAGRCLPGLDGHDDTKRRFGEWIDNFSWRMLHPDCYDDQIALSLSEKYATRTLKRRLPNLNVIQLILDQERQPATEIGLRCGFTVSIWSKTQPNIAANLQRALSPDMTRLNRASDLAYFSIRLPVLRASVELLNAEVAELLTLPQRDQSISGLSLDNWRKSSPALRSLRKEFKECQQEAKQFEKEEWKTELPHFTQPDNRDADEMRKEINQLVMRIDDLDVIVNWMWEFLQKEPDGRDSLYDYVVRSAQEQGSKNYKWKMSRLAHELLRSARSRRHG